MGAILGEFAAWLVALFGGFGAWFASGFLARALTGIGLSVAFYSGFHAIFSSLSGLIIGYGGAASSTVDLLNMMGVGTAFNMMVSAYGVRVTMLSLHKAFLTA